MLFPNAALPAAFFLSCAALTAACAPGTATSLPTPVAVDPFMSAVTDGQLGVPLTVSSRTETIALHADDLRALPSVTVMYEDQTATPQQSQLWDAVPLMALTTFVDVPLTAFEDVVLVGVDGKLVRVDRDDIASDDLCVLVPEQVSEGDLDPYVVASLSDDGFEAVAVSSLTWE